MEITIKTATLANLEDILKLNHMLCTEEHNKYSDVVNPDFPISEEGRNYFKERIKNECALIAIYNNGVIGYLVGAIVERQHYRNASIIAEAENMYILEQCRSLGIGKILMDEFQTWAKTKNANILRVVATVQNTQGIEFYRKNGFNDLDLTLEKTL